MTRSASVLLLFSTLLAVIPSVGIAAPSSAAHEVADPATIEEIVVFGRALDLIGTAETASQGSIAGADLLIRPLVKTAELLESMPGMVVVQHSGSGKANQYFLRGFNLDHGTDYTAFVDDVPWNMRSHGHGQGYLDVNGLIPESVDRISYRKGPYWADLGDFSLAGVSSVHSIDRLEAPFVSAELGEDNWQRYAGGASGDLAGGSLTLIGEIKQYDGPWEAPEDLHHFALWSKYLRESALGEISLSLSGYEANWNPTEQIPERVIDWSVCKDAYCTLDDSARGDTSRWILTGQIHADRWHASLYGQHYDWNMSSNPTYDFQVQQFDRRWTLGGDVAVEWIDTARFEVTIGGNFRYDDVDKVGLDAFDQGSFVSGIADNRIKETSVGAFADATWHLTDRLRLLGGLRLDYYDFDVNANSANSFAGAETASKASPKTGIAYELIPDLELYGNWGKGFHSNDARGVVNEDDPVPGLSEGTGYEVGARFSPGDFRITSVYWWLDQDSELIFIGDSNSVEPKGGSEREGVELTLFWQPRGWLGVDAVWTHSRARFTDNPEGDHVEGAIEDAAQFGITVNRETWDASLRLRHLGPYALAADNSERADSLTTVNLRGARHWTGFTLYAEVINLFDSDGKEINYDYPAYVDGFDPPGLTSEDIDCDITDCRMSRATSPRALRVGGSYRF